MLIALILATFQVNAITIKGSEPSYAGRTLEFISWTDPVSKNEVPVFKLVIDSKGDFSTNVQVSGYLHCFSDFGIYRGKMILVPGQDITLQLPPLRDKSFEESKNPYFEPAEIWLKLNGGTDETLTNLVSHFDNQFYQLSEKYFNQLYYRQLKNYRDTIQLRLDKEFAKFKNPWFISHCKWRMKFIEADITREGREKLIASVKPASVKDWDQPAFADLLDNLFMNTLSIESKTIGGNKLKQWINQKNSGELKRWTDNFISATSPLSDLVLLKMLHDAFYSGDFSKTAVLQIIQSGWFSNNSQSQIKVIANEINSKLSFLIKGSNAPEICLTTLSGSSWCSTFNTKPWLYILFTDIDIPICQEQVKYLKTLAEKTGPSLQILLVVAPSQKTNIAEFISKNQVPGIVVTDQENNLTGKKYKVRSYPSAFLLDKNHQVVLAPAKTPLDGFEFQFAGLKKQ